MESATKAAVIVNHRTSQNAQQLGKNDNDLCDLDFELGIKGCVDLVNIYLKFDRLYDPKL